MFEISRILDPTNRTLLRKKNIPRDYSSFCQDKGHRETFELVRENIWRLFLFLFIHEKTPNHLN
jgi:hypothetical protein